MKQNISKRDEETFTQKAVPGGFRRFRGFRELDMPSVLNGIFQRSISHDTLFNISDLLNSSCNICCSTSSEQCIIRLKKNVAVIHWPFGNREIAFVGC